MIYGLIGFVIGVVSMMVLRTLLYRMNKIAYDAHVKRLEDEELLKQYKENAE